MSQDFLMRYPLIVPQGSLGTQEDNEMYSSSRYTEAKPSIFADLMMTDYNKNVVDKKETYTGEFMEPVILPALFPNALCNGRQAIGISMSHSSPPHNLTEVCNGAIALIQNPDITIDELMTYIPGPDFCLPNTIINSKDIKTAFETGKSKVSLKVRGNYEIEGQDIIFTSIPYRTYRNKIKEQIAENIDIFEELISDYDDESGLGQNRIIFHVKPGTSMNVVLDKLFTLTDLQSTVSYNMNFILNGTPRLLSLKQLLEAYVNHQEDVLTKATTFDMEKAKARAHILEGLIAAVDKINEVITLIKSAESRASARTKLIDFLSVDEIQANAILDMKLGKLTRIDKQELVNEFEEKKAFIVYCELLLSSKERRNEVLIDKIKQLRDTYGDERRTKLMDIEVSKKEKEVVYVEPEDCVVVVTKNHLIKRVPIKSYRVQKRNSVGIKNNGDIIAFSQKTNTVDNLMVFTSKGKMYRLLVDNIPSGTNASAGTPISSLINFEDNEVPMAYTTLTRDTAKKFIFFATKKGIVKKVPLEEYDSIKRTGVLAIKFKGDDELASISFVNQEEMILVTKNGMCIRFPTAEMPISSRIAQGVKGMNVSEGDEVISALPINDSSEFLTIITEDNLGKKVKLSDFTSQNRGGKGLSCAKAPIAGAAITNAENNLLVTGNRSSLLISSGEVPTLTRTSGGNIMLKNNEKIVSVVNI